MEQSADTYSKGVKLAKYALPAIAIGLFVSIFALGKEDAIRSGNILTNAEMVELATGQKITNPRFSGLTNGGDAFTLEAVEALPDSPQPERIDLIGPSLEIDTTNGIGFKASSTSGSVDFAGQTAQLEGRVQFDTTNGYKAFSDKIRLDIKAGRAVSPGPVRANGPAGSITAGSMQATQSDDSSISAPEGRLEFSGGVRLIYLPSAHKSAK
jgi:lipopolysaccharide export system protein LptC